MGGMCPWRVAYASAYVRCTEYRSNTPTTAAGEQQDHDDRDVHQPSPVHDTVIR